MARRRGRRGGRRGKGKRGRQRHTRTEKEHDWSDYLNDDVLAYLQLIPYGEKIATIFLGDPIEQHLDDIAETLSELAPHLVDQRNVLEKLRELLKPAVDNSSNQTEILEGIRDDLANFHSSILSGQYAAISLLAEAVKDIKRLADQAEKMSASLKGIGENLSSINAGGDYFPGRVYSWVRHAIETSVSSDVPHFFATFSLGNVWWSKFRDLDRENPLGPRYLGHKTDLDELCAFLADEVRPIVGPKAVLHVFMPTIRQMAMKEAVKLPDEMHPCVFDGQLGDTGFPFAYICFTEKKDKECLRGVGVLRAREVWASAWSVGLCVPILHQWFAYKSGPTFYIDPSYTTITTAGLLIAGAAYQPCFLEPPRTLGRPVEPGSRPWYQ